MQTGPVVFAYSRYPLVGRPRRWAVRLGHCRSLAPLGRSFAAEVETSQGLSWRASDPPKRAL
jgi:hypothetical protein